jgi:hypothetical protein
MQKEGNFIQRQDKKITGLEKKEASFEGFDIYNSIKTLTTITASSEFLTTFVFIIGALIFGFIFFYTNINANGRTRPTMFVGYCVWAWITMLGAILILRILGKFLAILWRKPS